MELLKLLRYIWRHPLNRGDRLAACGRMLRWQVASRLIRNPISLPFVESTRLLVTRGMTGATGNWYCGLHEVEEMGFVLHCLRDEDTFVDVGANVGSYSVLAAGAVGARVVAVEPIPSTFNALETNIGINGIQDRVQAHCAGLSDQQSEIRFTSTLDTVNHVLAEGETGPSISVPVLSMDELLGDTEPSLIKIDVEGHEKSVLMGARRSLSRPSLLAVLMEVNGSGARYGVHDDELLSIMAKFGFSPYIYDPLKREFKNLDLSAANAIFLRDIQLAAKRVEGAKRYRLVNGSI